MIGTEIKCALIVLHPVICEQAVTNSNNFCDYYELHVYFTLFFLTAPRDMKLSPQQAPLYVSNNNSLASIVMLRIVKQINVRVT